MNVRQRTSTLAASQDNSKKLRKRWIGPFKLTKQAASRNAWFLDLPSTWHIHQPINVGSLKVDITDSTRQRHPLAMRGTTEGANFAINAVVGHRRKADWTDKSKAREKGTQRLRRTKEGAKTTARADQLSLVIGKVAPPLPVCLLLLLLFLLILVFVLIVPLILVIRVASFGLNNQGSHDGNGGLQECIFCGEQVIPSEEGSQARQEMTQVPTVNQPQGMLIEEVGQRLVQVLRKPSRQSTRRDGVDNLILKQERDLREKHMGIPYSHHKQEDKGQLGDVAQWGEQQHPKQENHWQKYRPHNQWEDGEQQRRHQREQQGQGEQRANHDQHQRRYVASKKQDHREEQLERHRQQGRRDGRENGKPSATSMTGRPSTSTTGSGPTNSRESGKGGGEGDPITNTIGRTSLSPVIADSGQPLAESNNTTMIGNEGLTSCSAGNKGREGDKSPLATWTLEGSVTSKEDMDKVEEGMEAVEEGHELCLLGEKDGLGGGDGGLEDGKMRGKKEEGGRERKGKRGIYEEKRK
ncbi:hypothetical protein DFH27DRAFT_617276 [Peziza echinospora]|nr:hypothetical protein DFH27DRAFT_617276 [Peziza echinospora]